MSAKAADTIRLSDSVSLPTLEYASQGNAILGIRDSGKTYSAMLLAERLFEAGIPFIAFDPIGVWRFLKVPGAGRGYPVVVAHPKTGDVPLTVESAPGIVRAAMESNVSLVLDLYSMELAKADWRRIVESAVKVLLFENGAHGLRHIFIEEAAEFCPQRVGPEQGRVYSVIESLARMGGNAKLGYTLINQRAEEVNKAVLELCDCLFLHRQKGRNSLTALSKWLDFGNKAKTRGVIEGIAAAATGEAWVWPRSEADPMHVHIPKKNSFHPNRRSTTAELSSAKPVDVEKFVEQLRTRLETEAEEEAAEQAHDDSELVNELRARIAELEAREPEKVHAIDDAELTRLEKLSEDLRESATLARDAASDIAVTVANAKSMNDSARIFHPPAVKQSRVERAPIKRDPPAPKVIDGKLRGGEATILQTAGAHHPVKLTMNQLGTLSGYTPSTMRTYMPTLRACGYLMETPDGYEVTKAGWTALGGAKPSARTKDEVRDLWLSRLSEGEAKILRVLLNYHGRAVDMDTLIQQTGYTASTVRTYIPTLRRNKLIDAKELKASPDLL